MLSPDEQYRMYNAINAQGQRAIAAEYTFVPEGFEHIQFMVKSFAVPVANPEDVIESFGPGGFSMSTPQIANTHFKSAISLYETVDGAVSKFMEAMAATREIAVRPQFNVDMYRGTPEKHTQHWALKKVTLFGFEPNEVDYENKGQLTIWTGQMSYHYFPGIK